MRVWIAWICRALEAEVSIETAWLGPADAPNTSFILANVLGPPNHNRLYFHFRLKQCRIFSEIFGLLFWLRSQSNRWFLPSG